MKQVEFLIHCSTLVYLTVSYLFYLNDERASAADRVALLSVFPNRLERRTIRLGPEVVETVQTFGQWVVGAEVRLGRKSARQNLKGSTNL